MRCEGYRRYGGAFSMTKPRWEQCKNDAVVTLTVKQAEVEEMPACMECWNEAKEHNIEIISAEPISN